MKIATIIARILLGLVFFVFGLNGFLHFLPMPELPDTPAGQFIKSMFVTGYLYPIAFLQVVGGFLLLIGRFVPLGLTLLGPIIVNIVMYHVFMDPAGMPMAAFVSVLAAFLLWRYWAAFAAVLRP